MKRYNIKAADFFIIGLIIILGLTGFWLNWQEASAAERKYATIYLQNKAVTELSLAPGEQFTYTLFFGENNQHEAFIEVDNGRIRMLPLSEDLCPRAVCSHTGWIEQSYESIVCLPNQIMIVFSDTAGSESKDVIDSVTY
jgi:hypothetical protein